MKVNKKRRKKNWAKLFFLHRYLGISISLFVIILAVTGILLNHTDTLELHKRPINSTWLMKLYGIKSPEVKKAYSLPNDNWVAEFANYIYLEQKKVSCQTPLNGAMIKDKVIVIASEKKLCLITSNGDLIDYLVLDTAENSKHYITRMGRSDGEIVIDTTMGLLAVNADYTALFPFKKKLSVIEWQEISMSLDKVSTVLKHQYQGSGLSLERVLLDLHSGRIMTQQGVYFMDLVAILLILMTLSGLVMWARPFLKRKRRHAKSK